MYKPWNLNSGRLYQALFSIKMKSFRDTCTDIQKFETWLIKDDLSSIDWVRINFAEKYTTISYVMLQPQGDLTISRHGKKQYSISCYDVNYDRFNWKTIWYKTMLEEV